MTATNMTPPRREDIESRWRAVASETTSRESVHDWSEPLMLAHYDTIPDLMVMSALDSLHGFDLTWRSEDRSLVGHGPPGQYIRSLEQIADELQVWLEKCHDYDADPVGWVRRARSGAGQSVDEEE